MKYLEFPSIGWDSESLPEYAVTSVLGNHVGIIAWHVKWQKYGFFPKNGLAMDEDCTREITDFLNELKAKGVKDKDEVHEKIGNN